jgi:hypothetical protein
MCPGHQQTKLLLRLPDDLKAFIKAEAKRNMRSQNGQVVLWLQATKNRRQAVKKKAAR